MTIDKKLLEAAAGEHRFNPDQQRLYLGTLAERVILSVILDDATNVTIQQAFPKILLDLHTKYPDLRMKLSASLNQQTCLFFLKAAQEQGIPGTIIDEEKAKSPYGIIVHAQEAVTIPNTDIRANFSQFLTAESETHSKMPFWQKWFS